MTEDSRYYQPANLKDALLKIQALFNSYANQPLTNELLAYHQKLIDQMQTNLLPLAKQADDQLRVQQINSMTVAMQDWIKIKLQRKPFNGKLKHFKLVANQSTPAFKRRVHKISGNQQHRSTRH